MKRLLLAGVVLSLFAAAALLTAPADARQPKGDIDTIEVGPDDDRLWPYTSRSTSAAGRTLVLNAIVMEDPETVERLLNRRADTNWTATDRTTQPPAPVEPFPMADVDADWRTAHGSVRYTYVETGKQGDGEWIKQRYQLHVGTYLGTRDHIRAFAPSEQSRWTALQAHSEYWDWFRLRHTVTDVRGTADMLETEFDELNQTTTERRYTRNSGPLKRGIVVVSSLLLLGHRRWSQFTERLSDPTHKRGALTVLTIALAAPLFVRSAGIALEQLVPLVTPKLFAVMLYPVLAVGLPFAVVGRSTDLPAWLAGSTAAVGLAVGFAAEFAFLGVVPPERLVWHRLLVAAALGLLAAGGARLRRDGTPRPLYTLAGIALWLWGLLAPLFGAI